jgi:hypothetical protein
MFAELLNSVNGDIAKGMFEAAGAIVLCVAVVGLCRHFGVSVERETAISIARGLVQMVFVGIALAVLLHGSLLIGATILLAMTFAAAMTASRRAKGIPDSLLLSFYAIAAGGGVVIAGMLAMGALTTDIAVLVPVGSMIIANAMNACGQSIERFRADVTFAFRLHRGGAGAGRGPSGGHSPVFRKRGLREPASPSRHVEIARAGLDTWRDGRNGGFGRQPGLRRHLSVRRRGDDPCRVGHYRAGYDFADATASVLGGRATHNAPHYQRARQSSEDLAWTRSAPLINQSTPVQSL